MLIREEVFSNDGYTGGIFRVLSHCKKIRRIP
jgi:hypothetical protein